MNGVCLVLLCIAAWLLGEERSAQAQPQTSGLVDSDVRIVPGTKWRISVTRDHGSYVSCQITAVTNSAELRVAIGSKGSPVILLQDQYQERAIRDTLGWDSQTSFRANLFIDNRPPIATSAQRIWEHTLLVPLADISTGIIFRAKHIAIAVGGISMRGYDVAGIDLAGPELLACYQQNRQ